MKQNFLAHQWRCNTFQVCIQWFKIKRSYPLNKLLCDIDFEIKSQNTKLFDCCKSKWFEHDGDSNQRRIYAEYDVIVYSYLFPFIICCTFRVAFSYLSKNYAHGFIHHKNEWKWEKAKLFSENKEYKTLYFIFNITSHHCFLFEPN